MLNSIKQELGNFEHLLGILYAQQNYLSNQIFYDMNIPTSTKHKECFINDETCIGKIKEAHILSRAATMSLNCGEAKGGLKVVQVAGRNKCRSS